MIDPGELRTRLNSTGLSRVAGKLAGSATKCVTVCTRLCQDDEIPVGSSKFGGNPDLPAQFQWPCWNDIPLSFLCQINLATLAGNTVAESLPGEGLLTFFYDSEQSTWGFDPKDRGSWLVHFSSMQDLHRTAPPQPLPSHADYSACNVTFGTRLSLPGWETAFVQSLCLTDDEEEAYIDVLECDDLAGHQLLGHPQEIQGSMALECQLASNGIYCGSPEGYNDPRVAELENGAGDWMLLLQIDSDDNPGWMWGDCGRLYFWITKADLAAAAFDRVWMVLQCS